MNFINKQSQFQLIKLFDLNCISIILITKDLQIEKKL